MALKSAFALHILIAALLMVGTGTPWAAENALHLNLCQELVGQARNYEARAAHHAVMAKTLRQQIEVHSSQVKSAALMSLVDNLFAQYDEHRAMENKFRDLCRKASDEAGKCMKSGE